MPSSALLTENIDVDITAETHEVSLSRLDVHRQALERSGVPPVSELGTLDLAEGLLATPGVVHAPAFNPTPFPFINPSRAPSRGPSRSCGQQS